MKRIGINVNMTKDPEGKMLHSIISTIKNINDSVNISVYKDCAGLDTEESKKLDVIIVLGGDGTILNTSCNLLDSTTPILGVNIGHLGFLAQIEINSVRPALERFFKGDYTIEDKTMIHCSFNDGTGKKSYDGLNDIILYKGIRNRIEKYDIFIDDEFYNAFSGDGIIISTSTGSTAYNLSAGGPIIHSNLDAFCITPMYSQFLTARTIVLKSSSRITIKMKKNNESAYLSIDGQEWIEINGPITINISKSVYKRKLIKFKESSFFKTLRDKITSGTKECEGEVYESYKTRKNT